MTAKLLEVKGLRTYFYTYEGVAKVINGLDLTLQRGEILGLIGETGSGKSVAAKSIINLVDYPGQIVGGEVLFGGEDLLRKSASEMRLIRGKDISLIVSEPRLHLNPLLSVGEQITNVYLAHHNGVSKHEARRHTLEMLKAVGIQDAEVRAGAYPHQLSGGMAQRVLIGMALISSPRLLLSDDSTSNLDVTIQRQVLDMMQSLVTERDSSVVIITHDLGVIAHFCQRIALMYAGQIVEEAPVRKFFTRALHPYSLSVLGSVGSRYRGEMESSLTGRNPSPVALPSGCYLHPRCSLAEVSCQVEEPEMVEVTPGHSVRCPVAARRELYATSS